VISLLRGRVAGLAVFGVFGVFGVFAGCTVGDGRGEANGQLQVIGCDEHNSLADGGAYKLDPSFFAGSPIEDPCPPPGECSGPRTNRITIRLQQTGNQYELTDTLFVDVLNSYEVARCLRGQVDSGVPQWSTIPLTGPDGKPIPGTTWCSWNAADNDGGTGYADGGGPDVVPAGTALQNPDGGAPILMTAGRARINLSTQDFVQASFSPAFTCVEARAVAIALPGSWIDFEQFGSAEQPSLTPGNRTAVPDDFKVDFGQNLNARFHLILGDSAVQYAIKTNDMIPRPRIGGALDGYFDFDLERGRAAQPFP
jgi:hypothetical protein